MLQYLRVRQLMTRTKGGRRRLRLFGCACCRRVWEALPSESSRRAVEQVERFVDESRDRAALATARRLAAQGHSQAGNRWKSAAWAACRITDHQAWLAAGAWRHASGKQTTTLIHTTPEQELAAQAALLRCLFGNPFLPSPVLAADLFTWHLLAWRDGLLVTTARRMYDARDFTELPVLADMLEDAGCKDEQVLAHCRGPGPHARGCFVVDGLLALN
jgi:hypothetical protein